MRLLAFDPGTVRIGIAFSENGILATPAGYIKNNEKLKEAVKMLIEKYRPGRIIIGDPKNMDGTKNPKSRCGDDLAEMVRSVEAAAEVIMWDERLTSAEAGRILIEGDVSRKKRKEKTDALAAAIILQDYINKGSGK